MTKTKLSATSTCGDEALDINLLVRSSRIVAAMHDCAGFPSCDDRLRQADQLVRLFGIARVRTAVTSNRRDLDEVAAHLLDGLPALVQQDWDLPGPAVGSSAHRSMSVRRLSTKRLLVVTSTSGTIGEWPAWTEVIRVVVAGPYRSLTLALEAHPELLRPQAEDARVTCPWDLEPSVLNSVENETTFSLNDVWVTATADSIEPVDTSDIEQITMWSNGDDYDYPGGDLLFALGRFFGEYFAHSESDGWQHLGTFETEEQAVEAWEDAYLKGVVDGYE